jgi:SAM-dependent MidA family methyltransferase
VLREKQKASLPALRNLTWHDNLATVPDGPSVIFANEYFDVLPVHQVVRQQNGWHERMVDLDATGKLMFSASPAPIPRFDVLLPPLVRAAPVGAVFEWRPDSEIMKIASRVRDQDGAALIIDYGHADSAAGETLQAVGRHAYVDPLTAPGSIDLTAHVDFAALSRAAEAMGAKSFGPVEQSEFLRRLGVETRAAALKAKATSAAAAGIDTALARLTGHGRTGMGTLFKAAAYVHAKLGTPPGFA